MLEGCVIAIVKYCERIFSRWYQTPSTMVKVKTSALENKTNEIQRKKIMAGKV
jgi:hypothetical protein